jgi:AraC-like DNA-binding protein
MPNVVNLKASNHENIQRKLKNLCEWIELNINGPIGWAELIKQSGMNHLELQREFLAYLNETPMQWIRHRRQELTHTSMAEQFLRQKQLPENMLHKAN